MIVTDKPTPITEYTINLWRGPNLMGSLGLHTLVSDCLTDISWYQDLYIYYANPDVGSDR